MTRDEILALSPGRELDVLVAERVMGWKVVTYGVKNESVRFYQKPEDFIDEISFKPSTDISASWEVIKTRELDCYVKWDSNRKMFEVVMDYVIPEEEGKREWGSFKKVISPTAPEAISKCALLAVMNL